MNTRRAHAMIVAAVGASMFVDALLYSVVVPGLPGFAARFDASPAQITVLYASYAAALLAATPLAGRWGDRAGHAGPFVIGVAGVAASTICFAVVGSYAALFASRALQGAAAGVVWTCGIALVAQRVDRSKLGAALGVVMGAMSIGLIVGPPVGGLLIEHVGPSAPFVACAAAATVVALLTPMALRPSVALPDKTFSVSSTSSPAAVLRNPSGRGLLLAVLAGAGGLSLLEPLLPFDLEQRLGAGPLEVGVVFGLATLANGICSPIAGVLVDRRPCRWYAPAALAVMGALALLLAAGGRIGAVAAILVGFAVAYSLVLVTGLSGLADVAARSQIGYGAVYAAFNIVYAVGMVAGPLLGAAALGLSEGPAPAYVTCGSALLACAAVLALQARSTRAAGQDRTNPKAPRWERPGAATTASN